MNNIGFVKDIKTVKSKTFITLVLNYEELERTQLKLGEFLKIESGVLLNNNKKFYLGRIEKIYYSPIQNTDYSEALALNKLNNETIDSAAVKSINFLHYDICILGEVNEEDDKLLFFPSTRTIPSIVDLSINQFQDDELEKIINTSLNNNDTDKSKEFTIGFLEYGSDPKNILKAKKIINIENFIRKRTANLGKTGFGKSNENKIIITLLAKTFPELSMVIFDLDGEYAFVENQSLSMGLYPAFKKLGMQDKIVIYTDRKEIMDIDNASIKPFSMNFYESPEIAIQMLYEKRLNEQRPANYIEAIYNDIDNILAIPNRRAYLLATFRKAGLKTNGNVTVKYENHVYEIEKEYKKYIEDKEDKENLFNLLDNGKDSNKTSKDSSTSMFYKYSNTLTFLKKFHSENNNESIFELIKKDIKEHKIVILDLPSISSYLYSTISKKIASEIFIEEQELLLTGKTYDVIFLIEEAQDLLNDKNEGNIWYKIAKRGRKHGIGLIYSTQSPKAIPDEILSQTENFFVKHLSSSDDIDKLAKSKVNFTAPISEFILNEPIIGTTYIYTEPYQPFVVSVKIKKFDDVVDEIAK